MPPQDPSSSELLRTLNEAFERLSRGERFGEPGQFSVHLQHDDAAVRAAAVGILALYEDNSPGILSALRACLEDDHSRVRQEACAALGDLGDREAIELLAARLTDPDPQVQFEAAFALAALSDARAQGPLEAALSTRRLRLDAIRGLELLGDPGAVDALEKYTTGWLTAWVDRLSALAAMFRLGRADAGAQIIERTGARGREERAFALSLIGSHQIEAGRDVLERVAADVSDPLRDTAAQALEQLGA